MATYPAMLGDQMSQLDEEIRRQQTEAQKMAPSASNANAQVAAPSGFDPSKINAQKPAEPTGPYLSVAPQPANYANNPEKLRLQGVQVQAPPPVKAGAIDNPEAKAYYLRLKEQGVRTAMGTTASGVGVVYDPTTGERKTFAPPRQQAMISEQASAPTAGEAPQTSRVSETVKPGTEAPAEPSVSATSSGVSTVPPSSAPMSAQAIVDQNLQTQKHQPPVAVPETLDTSKLIAEEKMAQQRLQQGGSAVDQLKSMGVRRLEAQRPGYVATRGGTSYQKGTQTGEPPINKNLERDWDTFVRGVRSSLPAANTLAEYNAQFDKIKAAAGAGAQQIPTKVKQAYLEGMPPDVQREYRDQLKNDEAARQLATEEQKTRVLGKVHETLTVSQQEALRPGQLKTKEGEARQKEAIQLKTKEGEARQKEAMDAEFARPRAAREAMGVMTSAKAAAEVELGKQQKLITMRMDEMKKMREWEKMNPSEQQKIEAGFKGLSYHTREQARQDKYLQDLLEPRKNPKTKQPIPDTTVGTPEEIDRATKARDEVGDKKSKIEQALNESMMRNGMPSILDEPKAGGVSKVPKLTPEQQESAGYYKELYDKFKETPDYGGRLNSIGYGDKQKNIEALDEMWKNSGQSGVAPHVPRQYTPYQRRQSEQPRQWTKEQVIAAAKAGGLTKDQVKAIVKENNWDSLQ